MAGDLALESKDNNFFFHVCLHTTYNPKGQLFTQSLVHVSQNHILSYFFFDQCFYLRTIFCEHFNKAYSVDWKSTLPIYSVDWKTAA